jgi:hypothetical protein
MVVVWACNNGAGERVATPVAFGTIPVPSGDQGIEEFSPECDAAMIRAAREEAPLKEAIFACGSMMEWAGATRRYPRR